MSIREFKEYMEVIEEYINKEIQIENGDKATLIERLYQDGRITDIEYDVLMK